MLPPGSEAAPEQALCSTRCSCSSKLKHFSLPVCRRSLLIMWSTEQLLWVGGVPYDWSSSQDIFKNSLFDALCITSHFIAFLGQKLGNSAVFSPKMQCSHPTIRLQRVTRVWVLVKQTTLKKRRSGKHVGVTTELFTSFGLRQQKNFNL